MAENIAGIIVICVFYVAIVLVGILAARKFRGRHVGNAPEMDMVAGRNLNLMVGIITTAATFVGGGYINGTAEGIATPGLGLAWTLAPAGIMLGTIFGGVVFGSPLRRKCYVTMLDPLQERYGDVMTGLLFLGALSADLLWAASILGALGSSLNVITDLDATLSIIISALVAMVYTLFGQMVSVAYTDILQLIFMVIGLVLCLPFALTNDAVSDIRDTSDEWLGSVSAQLTASYVDFAIVQTFGSIPWQTFFQRLLSARSVRDARVMAVAGGISALLLGIPPVLIGAVGVSADWNATDLGESPIDTGDVNQILPLVLQYLTPEPVAIIGLAAVVAAVMSSMDSIVLSSSSMFTHNVYRMALRKRTSDKEIQIVQRLAMVVTATLATVLSIFISSIFSLFFLAADAVYIILLPQLTCAVFVPEVNAYGSFLGYATGVILRVGGGDPALGITPFIKYPYYDDELGQLFPYKTFAMMCSIIIIITISCLANLLFRKKILPSQLDIAGILKGRVDLGEGESKLPHPNQEEDYSSQVELTKF